MKNLTKKILSGGLFLLQLFSIGTAFAAYSPQYFMPQNSSIYMQFDTTKDNLIDSQLQEIVTKFSGLEKSIPQKLLSAAIENTVIGYSETTNPDQNNVHMMAFSMDESTFNQIVSEGASEIKIEKLPMDRTIYLTDENFFFTYKLGNVIASSQRSLISDVLMTDNSVSLLKNPNYQDFTSKINTQGFFLGFVDLQNFLAEPGKDPSPITIEGFSASQDAQGLNGQVYLKFSPDSLYKPENFQFTPELYQKISSKNLIYFQEYQNLSNQYQTAKQTISSESDLNEEITEISDVFGEMLGVDPFTELLPLFEGKSAIAVHSDLDYQYFPAFSLLTDVKGKETQAGITVNKIQNALLATLTSSLQESYEVKLEMQKYYNEYYPDEENPYANLPSLETLQKQYIQTREINLNGSIFKQISIDPTLESYSSMSGDKSKNIVNITFGVTSDGYLLLSTLKNPSDLFAYSGLNADPNFRNTFSGQKVTGLGYLNFINLRNYLHQVLSAFDTENYISEKIDSFLEPFHAITVVSTASSTNTLLASARLNADLTKLPQTAELWMSLFDEFQNFESRNDLEPLVPFQGFPDVGENDWFFFPVNSIHDRGIMNGYDDGYFRPNQPITRAEFIKTLVTTLDYDYYKWRTTDLNISFKDIDSNAWYSEYVQKAAQEGLIKGYSDGTFRPNQTINRAEAIQILFNASQILQNTDDIDFSQNSFIDVKSGDWFFGPVEASKYNGIINGKTPTEFKPNDSLTRAETAKIIEQFLHL